MLGIVATNNLPGTKAGPGKAGVGIKPRPGIRSNRSRRAAADNLGSFGEGDSYTIGSCDRQRPFRDQLQNFVEHKALDLPRFSHRWLTCGMGSSLANLLVECGKGEKRL